MAESRCVHIRIVYRNDRNNEVIGKDDGGGCAIAIRKELFSARVARFELDNDIWVSVEQANGGKVFFNVKYVELRSNLDAYKRHFDKIVDNVMSSNVNDQFVLTGDYNLGDSVTWWHDSLTGEYGASGVRGSIAAELLDTLSLCGLNQVNVIRNGIGRTLDLFITTIQSNRVNIVRSSDPLVTEDGHHPALNVITNLSELKFLIEKRPPRVNFFKANYVHLHEDLIRIDWNRELAGLDIDKAVDRFYSMLEPFIDTIPKTVFPSRDYPVYYSHTSIHTSETKCYFRMPLKTNYWKWSP